ncbi:hypothetical protein FDP41_002270 [Naegleria fowleri]|uniref:Uncharacterized protein n=1 Tax=Naegleria fowleri TaxID=5763 RepID=A0A6A5BXY4_NAEFO|nr:uncharacterized protein FDP41_002270 [Naegleria fowleri]KAF0978450.1 hypothetical protein FDP41_002270 [Naegleria fowleri]
MSKLRIHNFSFGKAGSNFLTKTWLDTSSNPPRKQIVHYYLNEKYLNNDFHSDHTSRLDPTENRSSSSSTPTTATPTLNDSASNSLNREYNIFFPGDIQLTRSDFIKYLNSDYPFEEDEEMKQQENSPPAILEVYYENVFDLLHEKFPNSVAYLIIQPSQLDFTSFIYEYENFYVKGNANRLLLEILNDLFPHENFGQDHCEACVHLLAFSKGCVPLNALICEVTNFKMYLEQQKQQENSSLYSMMGTSLTFDHWNHSFKYRHWDEHPNPFVQKCYRVPLLQEPIPQQQHNNFMNCMQQAVNFFTQQVQTIYYLDCHRFITDEVLLQKFYTFFLHKNESRPFILRSSLSRSNPYLMIKIYQTPLAEEKGIYRRHIKVESELFMKTLKKAHVALCKDNSSPICPHLVYQYYYGELQNRVNSFVLHFKLLKDFQV